MYILVIVLVRNVAFFNDHAKRAMFKNVSRMCHAACFPPMCTAADSNINSVCLFSIILEEAQNKKLIQRSETIRDFSDVDGDIHSQYRSWETDYVERKEKMV
jgi:hypothetical protein